MISHPYVSRRRRYRQFQSADARDLIADHAGQHGDPDACLKMRAWTNYFDADCLSSRPQAGKGSMARHMRHVFELSIRPVQIGAQLAGAVGPASPMGHDVEAPAAALLPHLRVENFRNPDLRPALC